MKLSPPLRIAEVATLMGWSYQRTKRWLWEKHVASGKTLLEGNGVRPYTVTLAALYRAEPDLFEPPPGLEARVEENEAKQKELEGQVLQTATLVGALRKRLERPRSILRVA